MDKDGTPRCPNGMRYISLKARAIAQSLYGEYTFPNRRERNVRSASPRCMTAPCRHSTCSPLIQYPKHRQMPILMAFARIAAVPMPSPDASTCSPKRRLPNGYWKATSKAASTISLTNGCCKTTAKTGYNTHHLLPKYLGGKWCAENLVLLHPVCHIQVHQNQRVAAALAKEAGVKNA